MNVCYLIDTLANGGAETMLLRLLRANGWDSIDHSVCYMGRSHQLREDFEQIGVKVVDFGNVPTTDPLAAFRAYRYFRENDIDILHNHLPDSQVVGRVLGRLAGINPIISTHHNTHLGPPYRSITGRLERKTRWIDSIEIAVSEAVQESLATRSDSETWKVIPNAIDVNEFSTCVEKADTEEVRDRFNLQEGPVFLNIGRYTEQKQQRQLVTAMDIARDSIPDSKLLLVGWGEQEESLKRQVRERGLEDRVFVTGRVPEVYPYYAVADAFVLSSRYEGLPIVLIEAMAAGLPLIVSDLPGMREVVGDAGRLASPSDADALAEVMMQLSDQSTRNEHSRSARDRIEKFDINAAVAQHRELYRELSG